MAYRSRTEDMPVPVALTVLAIVVAGAIGWVMNIAKIVGIINDPISTMLIARVVGVFAAPLGAVLGWF